MRKAEEAMRASQSTPQVFMNAGGGAVGGTGQLRPFGHLLHIVLTVVTFGVWFPVWILVYIFRNRSVYF